MGNIACLDRDKQLVKQLGDHVITKDNDNKIEQEKKEFNLIPKKRDFFNSYKFIHSKRRNEKNAMDMQYFTIKRAKAVNSKKSKTFIVKECRKFHLNKVIR